MHERLVSRVALISEGINIYSLLAAPSDANEEGEGDMKGAVRHPGRCIIDRPFTSRRLQLITLLADILSYREEDDTPGSKNLTLKKGKCAEVGSSKGPYTAAISAMDSLMDLPLPPMGKGDKREDDANATFNPWPGLTDVLLTYPENNMYQIQFFRLLRSVCLANHEPTLKLVVQKSKFVAKAIRVCGDSKVGTGGSPPMTSTSHRGMILRCLNLLRLSAQSLPQCSFLRHYLDSHDGWKGFQDTLRRMTVEQQTPGGGFSLPVAGEDGGASLLSNAELQSALMAVSGSVPKTAVDIDLGSSFAADLGIDPSVRPYVEERHAEGPEDASLSKDGGGSTKKKKKGKKKKKKKKNGGGGDASGGSKGTADEDGDSDED
uniref:Uncharacterized protein n=1 Tax=Trieres chinensis TaxID=1514140 RepID=A0A7S2A3M3_TRICV